MLFEISLNATTVNRDPLLQSAVHLCALYASSLRPLCALCAPTMRPL